LVLKSTYHCSYIIHTLEYTIPAPFQKNKRTRLGKNKGEKGDKEEKGTHVNPAVRRKEVVKRYGERAEKDSGAKNDMVAHIPALEDFVKSSLEHMPRYLHSDAIKIVKQNHSSIVEMYEKIMKTQSQMPSKMESLVDRLVSHEQYQLYLVLKVPKPF
jgi:hypothetical protein